MLDLLTPKVDHFTPFPDAPFVPIGFEIGNWFMHFQAIVLEDKKTMPLPVSLAWCVHKKEVFYTDTLISEREKVSVKLLFSTKTFFKLYDVANNNTERF